MPVETSKRGGARRGPYSGKKMSFATKLTAETMERLTASAKGAEMSVSQKAEAAILRGLNAEEEFQCYFAPLLLAFETQMVLLMPDRDDPADPADPSVWEKQVRTMVEQFSDDLHRSIGNLVRDVYEPLNLTPAQSPAEKQPAPMKSGSPSRPGQRLLDLD